MKTVPSQPTIALIVTLRKEGPILTETLTSADEILELDLAIHNREPQPMKRVHDYRLKQVAEDEEFADFVEGLLSQPFLKPEVQEHAVQWFKSRVKIEGFQKAEDEASRVIAQYAYQIYLADSQRTDFLLTGPKAKVRIRVIEIASAEVSPKAA